MAPDDRRDRAGLELPALGLVESPVRRQRAVPVRLELGVVGLERDDGGVELVRRGAGGRVRHLAGSVPAGHLGERVTDRGGVDVVEGLEGDQELVPTGAESVHPSGRSGEYSSVSTKAE